MTLSQNIPAPKRYSQKFSKLIWKKIAWRYLLKSQKYWNCKALLHIKATTSTELNSLFTIDRLSVDVWWSYRWNGPNSSVTTKVYTRSTKDEAICLAVLFFYVLPRHANIMTDKGFSHFDECALIWKLDKIDLIWKLAKILWWKNLFLLAWQAKPLWVELKTNGRVVFGVFSFAMINIK